MKTTKSGRKSCAILPLRISAGVLLALCATLIFVACKNPMIDEFLGYPKLLVSAPIFANAEEGYAPVTTQISIQNIGKRTGYIKGVSVSPATAFAVVSGGGNTVGSGNSVLRAVQLKGGLPAGTYNATITVTYKGSDTSTTTAKAPVSFTVISATAPGSPAPDGVTRTLTVTAPIFDAVTIGASRPVPQIIDIKNTGNSPATISSVTVNNGNFIVGGSGSTVSGNSSIASWTVQPQNALGIGTHTARITVTYNGTSATTAIADVTVTVMARERFVAVTYGNNKVAYSADGSSWKESTLPSSANWISVTYGSGRYVAVAYNSNKAAYSYDGFNWIAATLPSTNANWTSVTYGNDMFVAVAANSNRAAYSYDGSIWLAATLPSSVNWQSVAYGNGRFVAVAYGTTTAYSANGTSWSAGGGLPGSRNWQSVAYGGGMFVAVVNDNSNAPPAQSTDGSTWTSPSASLIAAKWQSVAYDGNGNFLAVAYDNDIIGVNEAGWWSNYGSSWTALPRANWQSVTYGNGRFVAVGSSCVANGSAPNGVSINPWTVGTMPSNADWRSVTYGLVDR
ncbi:MAG: hypothetical protein Ta2A_15210 [Treponemataceae bacterium]|nr:MAG: hypothetical protein Ta2A_15210 [Treponemataceae bacterium]